jgi:hypothetical protein
MPKSDLSAHLILAEMALKRARKSVRAKMRKSVGDVATAQPQNHSKRPNTGDLGKAALLFGISRLASRSMPGAVMVGGGILAKALINHRRKSTRTDHDN